MVGASSAGIVAGTAAGDVKLFDTAMGELKWRAKNVVEGWVHAQGGDSRPIAREGPADAAATPCTLAAV